MTIFNYKAKEFNGHTIQGTMEAESIDELMEKIHRRGAVCIDVKKPRRASKTSSFILNLKDNYLHLFHSVNMADLYLFTHQLAAMFSAGIPLSRGLQTLSKETKNKKFKEIINDLYRNIETGEDLSDAMDKYPYVFDRLYVSLVRAGEVSGTLATILPLLASYIEKVREVKTKIISVIVYPIIIMGVATITLSILSFIVLPQFANIYQSYKVALPLSTRILFRTTDAIKQNILGIIFIVILFILSISLILQIKSIRLWWDKLKLKLPIIGNIILSSILAKLSNTMAILLKSGMPIMQSIDLMAGLLTNHYLILIFRICEIKIQEGASVGEAFSEHDIFPNILLQLIKTGEEAGTLSQMLFKAGDYYQKEVNNSVITLTPIIEPILIILIAGMVALISFAIFFPIFKIGKFNL